MKIDFSAQLKTMAGVCMRTMVDGKEVDMTLGNVCIEALLGHDPKESKTPGLTKLSAYTLAERIHNGETEYTPEEITSIRSRVEESWPTVVVGAAFKLLT